MKDQKFEKVVELEKDLLVPLNSVGVIWLISGWFSYLNSESIGYMMSQTILIAIILIIIGFSRRKVYWRKIE